jgi:transitional endoplasmic reticulum ATPase
MHTLSVRQDPIVCLYVKAIRYYFEIRSIFVIARQMAPCLLILEDIDTLVTEQLRSYFFNEVDGLENNDGIMMVATTNHLDRLDGGLAKRPSRFDRKYEFPVPGRDQRIQYCDYWRRKLQYNKAVKFPEKLSPAIADITKDFTFAYLKEAFVAALLAIARGEEEDDGEDEPNETLISSGAINTGFHSKPIKDDKDIAHLPLWIEIQKEIKILREDMNSSGKEEATTLFSPPKNPDWDISIQQAKKDSINLYPFGETDTQESLARMRAEFNNRAGRSMLEHEKGSRSLVIDGRFPPKKHS